MEKPVTFKNRLNQTLFGILHIPDNRERFGSRIGVNILNPGLKNRVAPNRLNVKIARLLCEKGFYVLRFDPFGIGDSDGELSAKNEDVMDLWGMIQRGAFVDDTIFSNNFFVEKVNLDKLILIGQCGAGVTALLCSGMDDKIDELILIDTPFRIISSNVDIQVLAEEYNDPDKFVENAIQDVFNPEKLKKLVTLNLNWRLHFNAMRRSIRVLFRGKKLIENKMISDRVNWQMLNAFENFMNKKRRVYFIYAENDFSLKEFNQDLRPNFSDGNTAYNEQYKIDIIKDANHIYTEIGWQNALLENILNWMNLSL
jgi:uncharacterized protein